MGDFAEEMKVSIIGDARDIDRKVQETSAKLKTFQTQANQQGQVRLRVTIAELESKIAEARKRLTQFKKDGDTAGEIKARLEITGLQQNKNNATKILRDLSKDATETGTSFFSLNKIVVDAIKAFGAFTLIRKVGDALRDSFDAAVSFESAFAGIKKTVDATPAEFTAMENSIKSLATQIPVTVEELSKIGESAGQLGVKKKDIIEFTKTIAAIAASTNLTSDAAATSFARIANIFQQPISKVENLASAVVELGNNFATTESEIVNFTTNIAGAGKVAGLSTADLAGIATAFTSVGIESEAGGTAISKALQSIADAVHEGGKDLGNFANVAGVSANDFAKLWRSNPAKAFDLFVQGLGKSGEDAAAVLEGLVGGDVRLKKAFLSVAGAGDLLTRAIDTSNRAFTENTALTTEANKRYETTESKLKMLDGRWNNLKIAVGNFLKTAAVPVLEFLVTLAEALGGAKNELSTLADIIKTAGIVLSTYFSLTILSKIASGLKLLDVALGGVSKAFTTAATTGGTMAGVLNSLKVAFAALLSGPALLVGALSVLTFGLIATLNKEEELRVATENLKQTLNDNFKVPSLDGVNQKFQSLLDTAHQVNQEILKIQAGGGDSGILAAGPTQANGITASNDITASTDITAGLNDAQGPSLFGGAVTDSGFAETVRKSAENVALLRQETDTLLSSVGLTKAEIKDFTSQLGLFSGATELSAADQDLIRTKIAEVSPQLEVAAEDFGTAVEEIRGKSGDWTSAINKVVEKNKKEYEKNGQNAEEMVKTIEEKYVANVAKSGDLGEAAAIAYGSGFDTNRTIAAMQAGVGAVTDEMLLKELVAAERSGDHGKAAGLLLALGIGSPANLAAVANNSNNLNKSIINAFEASKGAISATGKSSGATLISGIIAGINQYIPSLSSLLNNIAKSLGGLASFAGVFGSAATAIIGPEKVAAAQSFFAQIGNKAASLQSQFNNLKAAPVASGGGGVPSYKGGGGGGGGKKGGGGGGGADKAEAEAKKQAQEAEKAVDDYTKAIETNNKAAKKLRDDTVDFYRDIVNSIEEAKEKQTDLTNELTKFKTEQQTDFAVESAKRNIDLTERKLELEKDLKDAKDDLASIDATENPADAQQKQQDAQDKILEIQKKINAVTDEQAKIQTYLSSLTTDTTAAQKAYDDAVATGNAEQIKAAKIALDKATIDKQIFAEYTEAQRRSTLSEFEQNQLKLQDKIKEKEDEINAEIAKQQKIIDIQNQFLQLQNATSEEDMAKKQALIDLATGDEILSQEQRQAKLKELGFNDLTIDQQLDLIKQVQKANALAVETKQVEDQQLELLNTKNKYQDMAEQYHGESVDKMKAKTEELIALIQNAQQEQIKLNALRGAATAAQNATTNTTNLNVNNNINGQVDLEGAMNSALNKVK